MRRQISLSGTWQFQVDPDGSVTHETLAPDRTITVPLPWQAAFPDLQQYSGFAWYRRTVDLDESWLGGELLLHFGAVDYWCQIFVNGQLAGEHEGGYMPITLPVRGLVRAGENEIAVRVYDSAQTGIVQERWPNNNPRVLPDKPPFDAENVPHGKQEWYINAGGIWQDVTLTAVATTWIDHVHVTPSNSGQAQVKVALAGALSAAGALKLKVSDGAGGSWDAEAALVAGQGEYSLLLTVESPKLWEIWAPSLYTATVSIEGDELAARFGFREIGYKDGQLILNGEPIFLLSALDQDLYPETIYTVPSEEFLRNQFTRAKELGLNNLRCHIKPPDPRYLEIADEMGLLVWAEIPSWRTFYQRTTLHPNILNLDESIQRRAEQLLDEMVRRDFNHPSLIVWTIVNEDWGTSLPLSASDRDWVVRMYDHCKQIDPTRLVVDNSPCFHSWGPNLHVKSDLDDFHVYCNIPDAAAAWTTVIEQFNLRPLWTYTSHGDAQRSGQEPLILSEFGNWGLPELPPLMDADGNEPEWFKLGPWWSGWGGEPGWPTGVEARFKALGLDKIWGDYTGFARATQWHQFNAMKFEIETMRRQPNLAGYVITEFSDIYWESNGLLDFHRNPKVYHEKFATINAPDVIVPQLERYAYWDDEAVSARLHLSRYGAKDWAGAKLSWQAGGESGGREAPALARGEVQEIGIERWKAPAAGAATIDLTLSAADGAPLASNQIELLVLPASERHASYTGTLAVVEPGLIDGGAESAANSLAAKLRRIGYSTVAAPSAEAAIAVTASPTAALLQWVREGGSLLYLCPGGGPFFFATGRGGAYSGNWMGTFSWLRPGVHRRLDSAGPLSMPFMHVMPGSTIVGVPVEDPAIQPDILAGQIGGWVNHPAVHTLQFTYGAGKVLMTTFNLPGALPGDPVAVALFHDMLDHLASDACQPTLKANY